MKKHSSTGVVVSMAALCALAFLLTGCSKSEPAVKDSQATTGHPTTNSEYLQKTQHSGGGAPPSGGH